MTEFKIDVKIDKNNMSEELRKNLSEAIERATLEVKEEVIDNIGHWYEKYGSPPISENYKKQLQKKGLLPHVGLIGPQNDKKKLVQSIGHKLTNKGLTGIIFTNRPYAVFIEKGTKKMPARPFFEPAVKRKKRRLKKLLKKPLKIV